MNIRNEIRLKHSPRERMHIIFKCYIGKQFENKNITSSPNCCIFFSRLNAEQLKWSWLAPYWRRSLSPYSRLAVSIANGTSVSNTRHLFFYGGGKRDRQNGRNRLYATRYRCPYWTVLVFLCRLWVRKSPKGYSNTTILRA